MCDELHNGQDIRREQLRTGVGGIEECLNRRSGCEKNRRFDHNERRLPLRPFDRPLRQAQCKQAQDTRLAIILPKTDAS